MNTTVFDIPALSKIFYWVARFFLALFGWQSKGHLPDIPKYVVIAAPHTSNWDFLVMLALAFAFRANFRWLGKDTLFVRPFNLFFEWCGGIPIDRSKSSGTVGQMVEAYQKSDRLALVIAPEGTRSKSRYWKTGFYHIARNAAVPIVLGYMDYGKKTVGFGPTLMPTDDMEADFGLLQTFYAGIQGKNHDQTVKPVFKSS